MKTAKNTGQQGDVLLKRLTKIPDGDRTPISKGAIILAEGETTGHYHEIVDTESEFFSVNNIKILNLKNPATITHQEHKPVNVEAGIWQVGIVNEYDYFAQMTKKVVD